jgi:hypothetical protein
MISLRFCVDNSGHAGAGRECTRAGKRHINCSLFARGLGIIASVCLSGTYTCESLEKLYIRYQVGIQ